MAASSFLILYVYFPLLIYCWPFLVIWRWVGWFFETKLQLPLSIDLLRFASHPKSFRDSAKNLKVPEHLIKGSGLLGLSLFGFLEEPSLSFWISAAFLSALFSIQKPIKNEKAAPYHWHFPSESYRMISPPLLRLTVGFKGKKIVNTFSGKPHIIFLFLESFRSKNIGCLGGTPAASPHFDQLAKEGLLYTKFHANGLQTSRAIIASLFGIPPHINSMSLHPYCHLPLIGLPQILKQNGYQTALIQGSYTSFDWTFPFFKKHGFETIIGKEHFSDSSVQKTSWGIEDEALVDFASDWMKKQNQPTFLSLFTISNHHPWESPMKFPIDSEELQEPYKRYIQTFAYTDYCLGKFMSQIENSIVFIFGDHGQEMGERHSNYAIHNDLYEENIHVPLLIHGLGKGKIDTPTSQVDLLPTVLDLLDIQAIHHSVGRSLLREGSSPVFFSLPRQTAQMGCIEANMKAINEESYNLESDPNEKINLGPSTLIKLAKSYFQTVDKIYAKKGWAPKTIEKVPFEIKAHRDTTHVGWHKIIRNIPFSPIIDFSDAPLLGDEALFAIGPQKAIHLHELNLSHSYRFTDKALHWVADHCPNLSIFDGSHSPLITNHGVKALLNFCHHLKFLKLEENDEMTKMDLLKAPCNLNALHLIGCSNMENLSQLLHHCPYLDYLATSCAKTEEEELFAISNQIKGLVHLWLKEGSHIHDHSCNHLLENNPNLNILILEDFPHLRVLSMGKNNRLNLVKFVNCPNLTDETLKSLSGIHLQDLTLISCPQITEKGLKYLNKECKIIINNCNGIDKEAIEMMTSEGLNIF